MSPRAIASRVVGLLATLSIAACSLPSPQPAQVGPDFMTAPMSAAEVRVELERVMSETPLPRGAGWTSVVVEPSGPYGAYGGGAMVEFQALCAWLLEAAEAAQVNDLERLTAVDAVLADVPSWRTFSDPILMDETSRAMVLALLQDAERRDFGSIEGYLSANCS
jgi:hypothetical protein